MPWPWIKGDFYGLVYCVNHESKTLVPLSENVLDLTEQGRIYDLVEAIYRSMRAEGVQYALEPIPQSEHSSSSSPVQQIRTPSEILGGRPKEGTCLDLALFFCGVCLGYGLLPVLIVLEDHVFVAIAQNFDLRRWERRNARERSLFDHVLVGEDKAEDIRELIVSESYLAVECTGIACSLVMNPAFPEGIGREPDGAMSFGRATDAGREHFEEPGEPHSESGGRRRFVSAIDYGTAYRFLHIDPLSDEDESGRPFPHQAANASSPDDNPLPYLLNRSEQETELKKALLGHRALAPHRPLVCLIHGDVLECHEEFMNRLYEVSLPKFLAFWYPQRVREEAILRVTMEPSVERLGGEDWEQVLWSDLALGATDNRDTPRDAVINLISRRKLAVMIEAPLFSEKLSGMPLDRLDRFFEFWNRWQNTSEDLLIIVCLNLKYQPLYEGGWRNLWRGSLNDKLRRYVDELDFGRFPNVHGVCLPRLEAVSQTDAATAVRHARRSRGRGPTERDVIRAYNKRALQDHKGRIPMFHLLGELLPSDNNPHAN